MVVEIGLDAAATLQRVPYPGIAFKRNDLKLEDAGHPDAGISLERSGIGLLRSCHQLAADDPGRPPVDENLYGTGMIALVIFMPYGVIGPLVRRRSTAGVTPVKD